jgi:diguanylate cyclase (GGDEF)-like protein
MTAVLPTPTLDVGRLGDEIRAALGDQHPDERTLLVTALRWALGHGWAPTHNEREIGLWDSVEHRYVIRIEWDASTSAYGHLVWVTSRPGPGRESTMTLTLASVSQAIDVLAPLTGHGEHLTSTARRATIDVETARTETAVWRGIATVDELTGLLARRGARLAYSTGGVGAVLIVDVDEFKAVNDTYGHPVGDEVLVTVARRLEDAVGLDGVVCRVGGDEFALLLDQGADAELVAGYARAAVDGAAVELADGRHVDVTVSIGSTAVVAGESLIDVMRRADADMYRDKHGARPGPARDRRQYRDAPPAAAA